LDSIIDKLLHSIERNRSGRIESIEEMPYIVNHTEEGRMRIEKVKGGVTEDSRLLVECSSRRTFCRCL